MNKYWRNERILKFFRKLRTFFRFIFRNLINKRASQIYQKNILELFPDIVISSKSNIVLDIGANFGHFTQASLDLGFRVVAVEPHPICFQNLERRFGQNPKVTLLNCAISNLSGEVNFYLHPLHNNDPVQTSLSATTISDKFDRDTQKQILVEAKRIESFFLLGQEYALVKVDIEGAEMHLVKDLIRFTGQIQRLALETHFRFMANSKESDMYVEELGRLERWIKERNLTDWRLDWI